MQTTQQGIINACAGVGGTAFVASRQLWTEASPRPDSCADFFEGDPVSERVELRTGTGSKAFVSVLHL